MATVDRPTSTGLPVAWHVSTRSGNGSANCVEAGPVLDGSARYAVRDSKDRTGPTLVYPATAWAAFLTDLHTGRFDLSA
ncbi:DUF397 domain-containing protein [Micromonospora sp. SH-82]|uniref:DUF397 domain-containing protein n=1 Tax=Micromonospora sp. SH-82 TaxID=3132938 RepID=UPI003EBBD6B0